jgi:hypothetical protein
MSNGSIFLRETNKKLGLNPSPPEENQGINQLFQESSFQDLISKAKSIQQQQIIEEGYNCSSCKSHFHEYIMISIAILVIIFLMYRMINHKTI